MQFPCDKMIHYKIFMFGNTGVLQQKLIIIILIILIKIILMKITWLNKELHAIEVLTTQVCKRIKDFIAVYSNV